ncbi:hypothetical protein FNO01nite_33530 [Flavobacterium noncentrifugens]|uniref:histidine kinase n=1 Tax=Flavobacterium noncentrifugens TaxID=1128970 RepID=A0A1G8Y786_9FLAO|nr:tetratricopeptide repeat-containing sensor histidine kinase [Flavobacterium noncentrifugens]GEP52681.1 hypothetical protein FNO01nite_33530 [Flavobacterium noncentrifugens]SDJ98497.1 Signal transduction histidine kinase [Flavobacterium noncentrifugens]
MITNKLYSPFLFLIATAAILVSGCNRNNSSNNIATQISTINRQLEATAQTKLPAAVRIDSASAAYERSVTLDSAIFIWKAFNAKFSLLQAGTPEKAAAFLRQYTDNSRLRKDTLNLSVGLFETGKKFEAIDKPDSAYYYYNASRMLSEIRNDSAAVAEKLMNIAHMHYIYNDFAEFENTTTTALKFLPKIPATATDSIYRLIAYNNYGLAYTNLHEYESALQYYRNALLVNTNKEYRNTILNNIALVYMQMGNYKKAIAMLSGLKELETVKANQQLLARILDNLGYSQWKAGMDIGLFHMQQALEIRKRQEDLFETTTSEVHLAEYYKQLDPKKSKAYAYKAYRELSQLNSTNDRLAALKLLSEGNAPESKSFADAYITIKDSIDGIRQIAKNQFAKIKYDSKIANEENRMLRTQTQLRALQMERSLWVNIGLGFMLIVFAVIARLLLLLYRKRHKKEKILEAYQTERRISKKVHDELANDVFNTITFTQTQDLSDLLKKETLLTNLDSIYERARDISRENSPIDTGINYPLQLRQLLAEYQSDEIKVMIRGLDAMPWQMMEADKKQIIYRVLQELMVNMKKHSHAKNVVLQFVMEGKKAKISYSDNGVGMDASTLFLKNGLQNVENRIHAIGGHIIFESEPGKGLQSTILYPPENSNYV